MLLALSIAMLNPLETAMIDAQASPDVQFKRYRL